jgi:hypothetical protein
MGFDIIRVTMKDCSFKPNGGGRYDRQPFKKQQNQDSKAIGQKGGITNYTGCFCGNICP